MFAAFSAMMVSTAVLLATPASGADEARPTAAPSQLQISTRDLNLGDSGTRAALERRIDRAAADVCGVDPAAPPEARREQNLCMIAAGNAARAKLKQIEADRQIQASRQVRMAGL